MNLENIRMLELAVEHLGGLLDEVVFVGGATVELWITDEAAPEFRPTDDVDVIVEITTRGDYYRFEKKVRRAGLENDQQSGVICRFKHPDSGLLLDVMPTEASILGFENRWQAEAFPHAIEVELPAGQVIRAIPPAYRLATKLEAFRTRGKEDLTGAVTSPMWSRWWTDGRSCWTRLRKPRSRYACTWPASSMICRDTWLSTMASRERFPPAQRLRNELSW